MIKKEIRNYVPGEVVKYKNVDRIVLNQITMETGTVVCHIYHPERGVFSAYPDELKYISHLDAWDDMLKTFEDMKIKKSA